MKTALASLLVALFLPALVACSGTTTPVRTYLMRAPYTPPSGPVADAQVGLAPVVVAEYLEQPGIALLVGPNEVNSAQHHRWAEPVRIGLRATLQAELSRRLGSAVSVDTTDAGEWTRAVWVHVDQLHGTLDGEAVLVANFRIADGLHGTTLARHGFEGRAPLATAGHPALVEAEIALVAQLAEQIAQALGALP